MSAGLDWNEDLPYADPSNEEIVMTESEDPVGYVLTRLGVAEPGTVSGTTGVFHKSWPRLCSGLMVGPAEPRGRLQVFVSTPVFGRSLARASRVRRTRIAHCPSVEF
jgi:hypothetical protein